MAECHPVAFQWVMEAKARGAKVIHVDPRFTRTSAVADLYLPIRAGADIAFVGGLINYVLSSGRYFKDYVLAYTNAATILTEDGDYPAALHGHDRGQAADRTQQPEQPLPRQPAVPPPLVQRPQPGQQQQEPQPDHHVEAQVHQPHHRRPVRRRTLSHPVT